MMVLIVCISFLLVHFRIRVMDQHKPRTLSPPTSGNSFWTIEAENSIFNGKSQSYILYDYKCPNEWVVRE